MTDSGKTVIDIADRRGDFDRAACDLRFTIAELEADIAAAAARRAEKRVEAQQPAALEHHWPPIEIVAADDEYRKQQLDFGIYELAELVKVQSEQLRALEGLLKAAQRAQRDTERRVGKRNWTRGLDALSKGFSECGQTEQMQANGEIAIRAEVALGMFTGHYVLARGGYLSGADSTPAPISVENLRAEIAEHGLSQKSEAVPDID